MARISSGITGHFNGKVGPVVGATWKGIHYIRARGKKRTKDSPAQLISQVKFALVNKFVHAMKPVFSVGFHEPFKTCYNAAMSYNLKNAVIAAAGEYELDYSKVMISRGELPVATNPSVTVIGGEILQFQWEDNSGVGAAKATDKCLCVAFCAPLNKFNYSLQAARSDKGTSLKINMFNGNVIQTWLAFVSTGGEERSDSVYTGRVVSVVIS